jgi:hypothetical protein
MGTGDHEPPAQRRFGFEPAVADRPRPERRVGDAPAEAGRVIEAIVSPFQCLYKDALELHTQSQLRLKQSESEASRLARAAFLLYMASAEALVHQAAAELGRPELAALVCDPQRPRAPLEVWRLLPALVGKGPIAGDDPEAPPWPQFAELLALRDSWAYPGPAEARRAYYQSPAGSRDFEPLQPHQIPPGLGVTAESLHFPRTGLPRDPYALRPHHLTTAREVLDAAIAALDRRLGGALTRDGRHFKEPVRVVQGGP